MGLHPAIFHLGALAAMWCLTDVTKAAPLLSSRRTGSASSLNFRFDAFMQSSAAHERRYGALHEPHHATKERAHHLRSSGYQRVVVVPVGTGMTLLLPPLPTT